VSCSSEKDGVQLKKSFGNLIGFLDPCLFCFFYCVVVWVVCEYACLVGYGGFDICLS
jgi:hypothetical protein